MSNLLSRKTQESLENVLRASASQQRNPCVQRIGLLICLYGFTLCGEDGNIHTPTREECVALRDGVCAQEWVTLDDLIQSSLQISLLPTCEELPEASTSALCQGTADYPLLQLHRNKFKLYLT